MTNVITTTDRKGVTTQRIAAVLTVFNRRPLTLACLAALERQSADGVHVTPYVVDDGSTDGTGEAVAQEFPGTVLLPGDGTLYWNGGMRWSFGRAMAEGFDFYLWMNDDTTLDEDALERLLATYHKVSSIDGDPIVVGATREPETGSLSYGGVVQANPSRPLHFKRVPVSDVPQRVDTMNGNCVLIPRTVAERLGNIDPAYLQKFGDFDYGLRARAAGIPIWVTPGTIGSCAKHPPRSSVEQPLRSEVRRLWSDKELPIGPWSSFARRWGGRLWPLYFVSPYVRRTMFLVRGRLGSWAGKAA